MCEASAAVLYITEVWMCEARAALLYITEPPHFTAHLLYVNVIQPFDVPSPLMGLSE